MTANNFTSIARAILGAVLCTLLVACAPTGYAPTDKVIWAGYSALARNQPAVQLLPLEQAQQVYTIHHIGEGGDLTAPSFASIEGCAPASIKSRDGEFIGRDNLIELVPKQGANAPRITLSFIRWYDTDEWWVKQITSTSGSLVTAVAFWGRRAYAGS